jgi:hypothetical protein
LSKGVAVAIRRGWLLAGVGAMVLLASAGAAFAAGGKITRSDASAVAAAINLRKKDLPKNYSQQPNAITVEERQLSDAATSCYRGVPNSEALANVVSPNFVGGGLTRPAVSSTVEIYPSATLADKDTRAFTGPHALPCLQRLVVTEASSGLAKDETVTVDEAWLSDIQVDGFRTYVLRSSVTIHLRSGKLRLTVPTYEDVLGFTYGQEEVALDYGESRAKPKLSVERKLLGILAARAKASGGGLG